MSLFMRGFTRCFTNSLNRRRLRRGFTLACWVLLCLALAQLSVAQTKVDVSRQARTIDLSNLGPTKPVQVGTAVPATCSAGQMFFNLNAVPGANLYACTSPNNWVALFAGGTGSLSNSGAGIPGNIPAYLDNAGSQVVDTGIAGTPAVLLTKVTYQAGTPLDCTGQSGDTSTAMTCLLNPTLNAYGLHMPLRFTPFLGNGGAFTVNIDSLGAVAVKSADCISDPASFYFLPGQTYQLIYNGSVFCEAHAGSNSVVSAAGPYLRLGSGNYYLPFGFPASLPPTSGWTAGNFTGATFTTSGLNGPVQIQSAASRSAEALNLQFLPRSGSLTLTAAITSAGLSGTSTSGACGVGVYNSGTQASYVLMQQLQAASARLLEAGYSNPTTQTFAGNAALTSAGTLAFLQIQISGSNVITSYSATGSVGSWVQLNSRALGSGGMPASVDSWVLFGEPAGSSAVNCQVLSWSAQ